MSIEFPKLAPLIAAVNNAKKVIPFYGRLIALDPGQTTGYSVWEYQPTDIATRLTQIEAGQLNTWPMENAVKSLDLLFVKHNPNLIIHESYHIYAWKTDDHTHSSVPTLRVIGCIETLCIQRNIPLDYQSAQVAKNFVADKKLNDWGLWIKGQRHARDSIRHAIYYLMFRKSDGGIDG